MQFRHRYFQSANPLVPALGLERTILPRSLVVDESRQGEFTLSFEIFDRNVDRGDEIAFLGFEEFEHASAKSFDLRRRRRGVS